MRYETVLVVSGVRLTDPQVLMAIGANDNINGHGWSAVDGRVLLTVHCEQGNDPVAHAAEVAHAVEHAVPGARVVRVDEDLVTATDIAQRSDLSREMVRLLSLGQRGPGAFPAHRASLGGGSRGPLRAWAWADVAAWLAEHYQLHQDHLFLTAAQTAALNAHLQRVDHGFDQHYRAATGSMVSQDVACVSAGVYALRGPRTLRADMTWYSDASKIEVAGWMRAIARPDGPLAAAHR